MFVHTKKENEIEKNNAAARFIFIFVIPKISNTSLESTQVN
jgi:hypothetical protein